MKKIAFNINITTLIIISIIILIVFGGGFSLMNISNNRLKANLEEERKLVSSLNDSLSMRINKYGEVVNEKLTLQTSIRRLDDLNNKLTEDQRNLLNRLRTNEREKSIINAALIKANFIIDSLLHGGDVLIGDSAITFIETKNPYIQYSIDILDVMPINSNLTPRMLFRHLNIPNDTYVEFFWKDDRKEGYPISFSVTNTNKFMMVHNIESYAIPSLQKEVLSPNGWQRFNQWLDVTGGNTGRYILGGAIGFTAAVLIFK